MARLSWWRALFYLNLVILFLVIFYKIYLNFFEQDYGAVHAEQVERIESILHGEDTFSFAVVGNINNFNVIYLLSNGNPTTEKFYQAGQTDILVTWLFKLTMNSQDYGLAAAIGILVFVICATLSLIVYNNSKSMKDEEAFS